MAAELPRGEETAGESEADQGRPLPSGVRRKSYWAAAIAVVVIIAALSSAILLMGTDETLKVGVIVGEPSTFSHSVEVQSALEMAMEDLNEWGGIGRKQVELVIEQTATDSEHAIAAFNALEEEHQPLFYIVVGCELMSVLGPVAEETGVPLIGLGSAPGLTEGLDWVFRFYVSSVEEAAVASDMLDMLEAESLGILHSVDPHGCGINEALIDEFLALGGTVESEGYDPAGDVQESISNLSDNDVIYSVASCGELVTMLSEIRSSEYQGILMVASCGSIPQMWDLPQMQDVYVSAPLIYRAENIYAQDYMERFESTYAIPPTHHGAVVYDIMYLVDGLLEDNDLTRQSLKDQLDNGFVFSGTVGILRIDPGEHDFDLAVFPAMISEGGLRYL